MSLLNFAAIFFLVVFLVWTWTNGRDDTDEPFKGGKVSGLLIKIDYGTGLQYLVTPFGGITPRLDENGNHMKHEP